MAPLSPRERSMIDVLASSASRASQERELAVLTGLPAAEAWDLANALMLTGAAAEYAPAACQRLRSVRGRSARVGSRCAAPPDAPRPGPRLGR